MPGRAHSFSPGGAAVLPRMRRRDFVRRSVNSAAALDSTDSGLEPAELECSAASSLGHNIRGFERIFSDLGCTARRGWSW
jgi:hypothetical protein